MKQYLLQILIALDQLGTTLIGGYADETMSSYAYRMDMKGRWWGLIWRPVIDWVALHVFGQTNHCEKATLSERLRAQLPPELR